MQNMKGISKTVLLLWNIGLYIMVISGVEGVVLKWRAEMKYTLCASSG